MIRSCFIARISLSFLIVALLGVQSVQANQEPVSQPSDCSYDSAIVPQEQGMQHKGLYSRSQGSSTIEKVLKYSACTTGVSVFAYQDQARNWGIVKSAAGFAHRIFPTRITGNEYVQMLCKGAHSSTVDAGGLISNISYTTSNFVLRHAKEISSKTFHQTKQHPWLTATVAGTGITAWLWSKFFKNESSLKTCVTPWCTSKITSFIQVFTSSIHKKSQEQANESEHQSSGDDESEHQSSGDDESEH